MATNAFGKDFWVGQVWRSKDTREPWRHVIIADLRGGAAKCHTLLVGEPKKMNKRFSWISFKGLATRWEHCRVDGCYCKQGSTPAEKGSES